jgi:CHAD domain-containing protein
MRAPASEAGIDANLSGVPLLGEFGRSLLRDRLARLAKLYRKAARRCREDDAHAHRLRTATRRAASALECLAPWLPERQVARVLKQIRRIRRSAGAVRDLDVHREVLASIRVRGSPADAMVIDHVETELSAQRERALRKLRRLERRVAPDKLRRWGRRLGRMLRSSAGQTTVHEAATAALVRGLRRVRTALRTNLSSAARLHDLRLVLKSVRYTLEVFEEAFPRTPLRKAQAAVIRLLDALGAMNDLTVLSATLRAIREHAPPGDARLRTELEHFAERCQTRAGRACEEIAAQLRAGEGAALVSSLAALLPADAHRPAGARRPAPPRRRGRKTTQTSGDSRRSVEPADASIRTVS